MASCAFASGRRYCAGAAVSRRFALGLEGISLRGCHRVASSQSYEQGDHHHQHPEVVEGKLIRVSLIGAPNTGKSTLINALVGRRVCAASNKVHTTTRLARAIAVEGDTQIVFLDTPGTITDKEQKKYKVSDYMRTAPKASIVHADVIGAVHDVGNKWLRNTLDPTIKDLLVSHGHIPSFLVLNKIDLLKSKKCLFDLVHRLCNGKLAGRPIVERKPNDKTTKATINEKNGFDNFSDVFMVSALEHDGIENIKSYLLKNAKPGSWRYSKTDWTDRKPENVIVDIVRAKFLDFLAQELAYELKIQMEYFEERPDKVIAFVIVNCRTERKMKLIAGGADGRLMQITDLARSDLMNAFRKHVNLNISLRVPES